MATLNTPKVAATHRQIYGSARAGHNPACPWCGSSTYRIRRKTLDRFLSVLTPVQRYKCRADKSKLHCAWEGVVPLKNLTATDYTGYPLANGSVSTGQRLGRSGKLPDLRTNSDALTDMSFDVIAQIALEAVSDAVLAVNRQGRVVYLNKVAETMTGWSGNLARGRPVEEVFHIIDSASRQRRVPPSQKALSCNRAVELALGSTLIRRDGTEIVIEDSAVPIRNQLGELTGAAIVFHDAKLSGVEMQKMAHLAHHDALTGLPNRVLLAERLTQAIGMAKRHHKLLALLFLDMDRFKQVNDTLGHATGDLLLQDVAENILACVRTTDTVSRHGGDEFIILLPEIEDIHDPARVAEKLRARFAEPLTIVGHKLNVTLSIGISVYPDNGSDADALLRNADAAMYRSKEGNRNQFRPMVANA